jgi:hypothetical protein
VHENTIRHRMARISELTGLDVVCDATHHLDAQISLLTLWLQGRLYRPARDKHVLPVASTM